VRCATAVASAPALGQVRAALVQTPSSPFGVVVTASGDRAFVSLRRSIAVVSTSSFVPSLVGSVLVPASAVALGETLTPDGQYLLVASGSGAVVISVARAESGSPHAVLGTLSSPGGSGAIEVSVSLDGRYAFVSLEGSQALAVFNLQQALRHGFGRSDVVGTVPVGQLPVGMAFSPDGRWLYATSEAARGASATGAGTLSVISVQRAERDPARSVVSTVTAGCGAVRVVVSAAGAVVWVTARESDALLGFAATRLRSAPRQSLIARVTVGEAPVGLALVDRGQRIVVADSDRFGLKGATANLAVVSVAAALAHRPALLGFVRSGGFPRQMALEPGGQTLLVTNFASRQLEAVDVADLP
jgi:DNA-binding beta-propeller fold protein YncE